MGQKKNKLRRKFRYIENGLLVVLLFFLSHRIILILKEMKEDTKEKIIRYFVKGASGSIAYPTTGLFKDPDSMFFQIL